VRFGVNRDTISACCKEPESKLLQKQVESEMRAEAVAKLKALTLPAVDAWRDAIPIAARKGDHRLARELLQHVGIVNDPKEASSGLFVLTTATIEGVSVLRGSDGNVYTPDPNNPGEYLGEAPSAGIVVTIGGIQPYGIDLGQGPAVPFDGEAACPKLSDREGGATPEH
jgi:hypothetical protein